MASACPGGPGGRNLGGRRPNASGGGTGNVAAWPSLAQCASGAASQGGAHTNGSRHRQRLKPSRPFLLSPSIKLHGIEDHGKSPRSTLPRIPTRKPSLPFQAFHRGIRTPPSVEDAGAGFQGPRRPRRRLRHHTRVPDFGTKKPHQPVERNHCHQCRHWQRSEVSFRDRLKNEAAVARSLVAGDRHVCRMPDERKTKPRLRGQDFASCNTIHQR